MACARGSYRRGRNDSIAVARGRARRQTSPRWAPPGQARWQVGGGLTFTALDFHSFDNETLLDADRGFTADGVLSASGYNDTPGVLMVSTQGTSGLRVSFSSTTAMFLLPAPLPASVLLLLGALAGLALISRRRANPN